MVVDRAPKTGAVRRGSGCATSGAGAARPRKRGGKADGGSALMLAAAAGHEGVVRMLLRRADVEKEAVDKFKQTAAHRACRGGHARVVPLLAAAKCNLDAHDVAGETPMLLAAELGFAEAVASLIANGASTNLMSHERETPLSAAIMGKHVDAIKALLDADGPQKVRLSHRDAVGRTALMRAVSMDHTEMVQILLASGAPVGQGERGGSGSGGPGGSEGPGPGGLVGVPPVRVVYQRSPTNALTCVSSLNCA